MARYENMHYQKEDIHIKAGDKVRVPKDTLVKTTAPGDSILITKRAQTVTVHHVLPGRIAHQSYKGTERVGFPPSVVWAGAGGYWKEVDINDVERVEK